MKYNFDRMIDRTGTSSLKWDFREKFTGVKDILPMWVADMDFETAPPVLEAVQKRAAHGIFGYTEMADPYYEAFGAWMKKRFNWDIQRQWIVFTPGVIPALFLAVQAFTRSGEKVVIQPPVYHPFSQAVVSNGRQLLNNPLKIEGGRYVMDLEHLENSIDEKTRMLILCSPHNPVGRVWTKEELAQLGRICVAHKIVIVSDEIHADLIMKGHSHTPMATLSEEMAEITVTCTAPNKTFNIAGLETAHTIISNKALCDRFKTTVHNTGILTANTFGIVAAQAAYNHGEEWLEQLLDYVQDNYDFLVSFVKKHMPKIKTFPLEGTFLVWLDFRGLGLPDKEIKTLLRNTAKVWLDDGPKFGVEGRGFQRMNIGCPRKRLEEGLTRIAHALHSL
ncbi:MAG: PatB family C-S lyase [Candidatus Aminicenantales bacterium]